MTTTQTMREDSAQKVWLQEDHVQIQTAPSSDDSTNQNTGNELYCLDLDMTLWLFPIRVTDG